MNESQITLSAFEEALPKAANKEPDYKEDEPEIAAILKTVPPSPKTKSAQNHGHHSAPAIYVGTVTRKEVNATHPLDVFKTGLDGINVCSTRHPRLAIRGAAIDKSLKEKILVPISSACLSKKDIHLNPDGWQAGLWHVHIDSDGVLSPPASVAATARAAGVSISRMLQLLGGTTALVYASLGTPSLLDGIIGLFGGGDGRLVTNLEGLTKLREGTEIAERIREVIPAARLVSSSPHLQPDKMGEFEIEIVEQGSGKLIKTFNGEIKLNPISGYFPRTTIRVNQGRGKIAAMGLGLSSGDEVKCGATIGLTSGQSEISIKVI